MRLREDLEYRIILQDSGCWYWAGRWNIGNGYSKVSYKGKAWMVHRLLYTLLIGPIPDGLVLDHKCKDRACCNPSHVEPVTHKVNVERGQVVLFK